eukprot:TRINITY_DN11930_c0_g1_i1.p1 TRINITY_DN11930_c0_g1~~TRINITY_DN11930_c0_g1_i1.p1  ORF type:complete len:287 (-),score=30.65 TRINITY_DN11930_c0_g1_i1:24-884(-)
MSVSVSGEVAKVYRYYHTGYKDHYYTTDPNEFNATTPGEKSLDGYQYEDVAFSVFTKPSVGLTAVYCYWSNKECNHFYGTTHVGPSFNDYHFKTILGYISEKPTPACLLPIDLCKSTTLYDDLLITDKMELKNLPGKYELVMRLGYAMPCLLPVYMYHLDKHKDHFFTNNRSELGVVAVGRPSIVIPDYVYLGIPFQLARDPAPEFRPIFRFWRPEGNDHIYGIDENNPKGTREGILGYASKEIAPGLLPLNLFYSGDRQDTYIGTELQKAGYSLLELLGYVFPCP